MRNQPLQSNTTTGLEQQHIIRLQPAVQGFGCSFRCGDQCQPLKTGCGLGHGGPLRSSIDNHQSIQLEVPGSLRHLPVQRNAAFTQFEHGSEHGKTPTGLFGKKLKSRQHSLR